MERKVCMVIMSHLSDVQESYEAHNANRTRINFCKFLLLKYNTDTYIDPDKEYEEFKSKYPNG